MNLRLSKIVVITAVVVALAPTASVAAEVLGFPLTATTRQEFLRRTEGDASRTLIPAKDDYTTHGYLLQPTSTEFAGLKRVAFMFDPDDKLCLVYVELPAEQFGAQVQKAKANPKFRVLGQSSSPDGSKDIAFSDGTDRISIEIKAAFPSMVIMYMNEGYKKNSDARVRAHGYKPKYE